MSKVTELASGQITATETIKVELVQASQTPAVVIITWPRCRPCSTRGGSDQPLI